MLVNYQARTSRDLGLIPKKDNPIMLKETNEWVRSFSELLSSSRKAEEQGLIGDSKSFQYGECHVGVSA